MLVLELLAKKSMYGYEMIQTLKGTSEDFFALKEGTLYPILYRLEDNDFAKSSWSVWIQWQICGLPGRVYVPACAAGFLICLSVLIQPLIPAETAGTLYTYGNILGLYKWFTAFWLLATSGWAVCKKRPYCLAVLAGNSVFMCALVAGKMFPLHEPVLTGWFAELAGGVIILI